MVTPTRRSFLQTAAASTLLPLAACSHGLRSTSGTDRPPNVVVIFTDDQGYADVGSFGAQGFDTPNLDRMAAQGVRFTDFYVAQPVCGASRAALLTGCYPNRNSLLGAPDHNARHGIHTNEVTIAEMLKQKDYATAVYGKWHLGHREPFLPNHHGFDEYYGIPYSNDMWPFHPERPDAYPPLPLMAGNREDGIDTIGVNPDQTQLTTDLTSHAVDFIRRNRENPFFLYVAHPMPHVPLFVSSKFKGKSEQGMYGDVIMEIDWSVGKIMDELESQGLSEHTIVIFSTDNGPWLSYGNHAGSALPLREGKGTTWDGGVRVPTIMQMPGTLPAGATCDQPAMTIDIMPTIARMTGCNLPDHPIDGLDILPLLTNPSRARSPHDALYFYWNRELQAIRSGKWKLHFPHAYRTLGDRLPGNDGLPNGYRMTRTSLCLYDLEKDIGQTNNVVLEYPEVTARMYDLADRITADLGTSNNPGPGVRPPGRISA